MSRPTPEEAVALAREVGVREAARRTGHSKSSLARWLTQGAPAQRAEPTRDSVATAEGEGGAPAVPLSHVPSRATGTPGTPGTGEDTDLPPGWRPGWKRKRERVAEAMGLRPRLDRAPRPDEVPQDPRLSPEENIALHLLVCGYTRAEVCAVLGISEWQLTSWRVGPVFREVFTARAAELEAVLAEDGRVQGARALELLHTIAADPTMPPNVRAIAAAAVADRQGFGKAKRVQPATTQAGAGLSGVPEDTLLAEEQRAREELRMIQGGKAR